ncbi:MAG: metal-binding protein, partial [Dolichospermum sp.]
ARQGKTVQEVFILTTLLQDELENAIAIAMKIA